MFIAANAMLLVVNIAARDMRQLKQHGTAGSAGR
jgi:hypothetical protein